MPDLLKIGDFSRATSGIVRRLSGRSRPRQASDVASVVATLGFGAGVLGGTDKTQSTLINHKAIATGLERLFAQEKTFNEPDQIIRSIKPEEEPSSTIV
jgi:uncharacterized membrane protein YoaK (UPF0700 family)